MRDKSNRGRHTHLQLVNFTLQIFDLVVAASYRLFQQQNLIPKRDWFELPLRDYGMFSVTKAIRHRSLSLMARVLPKKNERSFPDLQIFKLASRQMLSKHFCHFTLSLVAESVRSGLIFDDFFKILETVVPIGPKMPDSCKMRGKGLSIYCLIF